MQPKNDHYVSRAAHKLGSVAQVLALDFKDKTVLDVGASSGGFSEYALRHCASKVIAVEKGTDQLNPQLRLNPKLESYEKTDIRSFKCEGQIDIVLIDVSFVSLEEILPSVRKMVNPESVIIAMAKPQFETKDQSLKHHGVIKNERMRRQILADLESWLRQYFVIQAKADSLLSGVKGNRERFFKLRLAK